MNVGGRSFPAKVLTYSTAAAVLTIGMRETAPVLTTIFFSIFVALTFTPLVRWLKRRGVPGKLSVILVILLLSLIILVPGVTVVKAAVQFGNQIPNYQTQLTAFADSFAEYIPSYEESSMRTIFRSMVSIAVSLLVSIVSGIVSAGATAGFVIVTAAFLLIDAVSTPEKVYQETGKQPRLRLSRSGRKLAKFLVIRAEVNVVTAIVITLLLFVAGIDFALLWGVLIFLLSYVPYIGLVIASVPPLMLALFKYGPSGVLAAIIIILAIDALVENIIFPSLVGKSLQLSPAFLFPALIYWGFVFGLDGVLLSIPLTIALKILLENFEETKRIARLMGPTEDKDEGKISSE